MRGYCRCGNEPVRMCCVRQLAGTWLTRSCLRIRVKVEGAALRAVLLVWGLGLGRGVKPSVTPSLTSSGCTNLGPNPQGFPAPPSEGAKFPANALQNGHEPWEQLGKRVSCGSAQLMQTNVQWTPGSWDVCRIFLFSPHKKSRKLFWWFMAGAGVARWFLAVGSKGMCCSVVTCCVPAPPGKRGSP